MEARLFKANLSIKMSALLQKKKKKSAIPRKIKNKNDKKKCKWIHGKQYARSFQQPWPNMREKSNKIAGAISFS